MNAKQRIFIASMLLCITASASRLAAADSRCDCSKIVGACTSEVSATGKWLKLHSSSEYCSRIDYSINGSPKVTTITGGEETEEWLGRIPIENITVESCSVCLDKMRRDSAMLDLLGSWNCTSDVIIGGECGETSHWIGTLTLSEKTGESTYSGATNSTANMSFTNPNCSFRSGVSPTFTYSSPVTASVAGNRVYLTTSAQTNMVAPGTTTYILTGTTLSAGGDKPLGAPGSFSTTCRKTTFTLPRS